MNPLRRAAMFAKMAFRSRRVSPMVRRVPTREVGQSFFRRAGMGKGSVADTFVPESFMTRFKKTKFAKSKVTKKAAVATGLTGLAYALGARKLRKEQRRAERSYRPEFHFPVPNFNPVRRSGSSGHH